MCHIRQALWFYCQPPMAAMQLLASVAAAAAEAGLRGAALIDLLVERRARVSRETRTLDRPVAKA